MNSQLERNFKAHIFLVSTQIKENRPDTKAKLQVGVDALKINTYT